MEISWDVFKIDGGTVDSTQGAQNKCIIFDLVTLSKTMMRYMMDVKIKVLETTGTSGGTGLTSQMFLQHGIAMVLRCCCFPGRDDISPRMRPELEGIFTVDEDTPVLSILCHGIAGPRASFLEMGLLTDFIGKRLPNTTVYLIVKLHEVELYTRAAWKTAGSLIYKPVSDSTLMEVAMHTVLHLHSHEIVAVVDNGDPSIRAPSNEIMNII